MRVVAAGVLGALACGCGRIGFDTSARAGDTLDGAVRLGDGTSGTDGTRGAGGDAPVAAACGTTVLVSDDFEATDRGSAWTLDAIGSGITVAQGQGQLDISIGADASGGDGYALAADFATADACATVEVIDVPAGSGTSMAMSIGTVNMFARFDIVAGELQAICSASSNSVDHLAIVSFDATADRYLRLRNASATWFWDVSADDATFTTLVGSACAPVGASNVLQLEAGAGSEPGTAAFGPFSLVH